MPARLRRNLTFANVCSFLALTLALGTGGAYAAGSVFSADIADGEVKNADLAPQAVGNSKIYPSSVTSSKILNGGVGLDDLAADSVNGGKVAPNSLTGADVLESSLAKVQDANTLDGRDAKEFARLGGLVNAQGGIVQGTGFTVQYLQKGRYQVSFPNGTLGSLCSPIVSVTSFTDEMRIPTIDSRGCSQASGSGSFTVKWRDASGAVQDTPFYFLAM